MWELIRANRLRTVALLAAMGGVLALVGLALGALLGSATHPMLAPAGLVIALAAWLAQSAYAYWGGGGLLLRAAGARLISPQDHRVLSNVVEEMAIAAGLPRPPLIYIIDDDAPNAFTTGRDPEHAAIAVTAGLLKRLTRDELQGVVGHEMAHVYNRDVLYMTMAAALMGTVVFLSEGMQAMFEKGSGGRRASRTSSRDSSFGGGWVMLLIVLLAILVILLAPILVRLLYLAVSRRREHLADACGTQFTRYPEGLAGALEKISQAGEPMRAVSRALAPLFIVSPLGRREPAPQALPWWRRDLSALDETHPPVSERIAILRGMAGAGLRRYEESFRKVTGRPVGLIPFAALERAPELAIAAAPEPGAGSDAEQVSRVRETTDLLWRLNRYAVVACPCGTCLKVPPVYRGRTLPCPHCGAPHPMA